MWMLTISDPAVQEIYNKSHGRWANYQASYQVPPWDLFGTFPWVCAIGFNQCKAYGNVTQYNKYLPDDNLLLSLFKQWQ